MLNILGFSKSKKTQTNRFFKPSIFELESRLNCSAYSEALVLASVNGVLDVTLTAMQSSAPIEIAGVGTQTVQQLFVYNFVLNTGSSTNYNGTSGPTTGASYVAPTFKVNPGDTLVLRVQNELENLTLTPADTLIMSDYVLTNMHTHGLHLSPKGSSDNVYYTVNPGEGLVYSYAIPMDQPEGLYWYHPHRHMYTDESVFRGMEGLLAIGSSTSNITQLNSLPQRTMAIQQQLFDTTTTAGAYIMDATGATASNGDFSLAGLASQYTINGLYQPTLQTKAGQSEVWAIANITNDINISLTLRNTTTNATQPIIIVATDGVALPTPIISLNGLAFSPGNRFAILVTTPPVGQNLVLEMAQTGLLDQGTAGNGFPQFIPYSYSNGFNPAPPQVLLTATPTLGNGTTIATPTTLTSNTTFVDLSTATVATSRSVIFNETFTDGPQFFINGQQFPSNTVFQPRLNTVEEWTLINLTSDIHPFHIHINDFQIIELVNPNNPSVNITSPQMADWDTFEVPQALTDSNGVVILDANGNVAFPGKLVIRTYFEQFTGSYVYHCHRLQHEDFGMMAPITAQPETPIFATAALAGGGPQLTVFNSLNDQALANFYAFEQGFTGGVDVAVADVNNDGISDIIAGAGQGGGPRVTVFNGATNFTTVLANFFAFSSDFTGGVDVAGGDLNGDGFDDIVVGALAGGGPNVRVFDGKTLNMIANFMAYDISFGGGVSVAVGDVDGSGFNSIITGAGPGGQSHVIVWQSPLTYMIGDAPILPGTQSLNFQITSQFFAYESAFTGGVQVSLGLTSGTDQGGFLRIITGTMIGAPLVTIWQINDSSESMENPTREPTFITQFFPFSSSLNTGVRTGSVTVSAGGSDLLVATGLGTPTQVARYSFLPGTLTPTLEFMFDPLAPGFAGGATVGGTN